MKTISAVLRKEILYDWRHFSQWAGLLAFLLSCAYILYFFMGEALPRFWNLSFWLIFMFLSFFTGSRSFEEDQTIFRHTNFFIGKPALVFWSKVIYLWLILSLFCVFLLSVFKFLIPIQNGFNLYWIWLILLVSLGFSIFTAFNSYLTSLAQGRQILVVIMTMPLSFPLIGMAYSISLQLLTHGYPEQYIGMLSPILAIDLLGLALSSFILPLIWKN